ncbi:DUF2889 domain-containing protein [Bradyrhizobium sp.]|uniref:DUF2889 domain-containing protein n=1 Tax=Bradyrhizobium sp. TaxID=376 RepID=UPI0025BE4AE5|nr:DUF2889 domain-containing protein [Bradyrhizobium sp.]
MPPEHNAKTARRHLHTRSVECTGYLRDDGLWEVEAWLRDTKPFAQPADRFRGELLPGDPVHDIGLRLAIDDDMRICEAEATMRATPYPTCIEVEPILQRLVGERIGPGWRELVRRKIGRIETCTHLAELLGPAVTTLFQTLSNGKNPEGPETLDQRSGGERPFFIGGCHSWRTDGPIVAAMFPQFATGPAAKD